MNTIAPTCHPNLNLATSRLCHIFRFAIYYSSRSSVPLALLFFFFLNEPAPPEIYPLSLHDPLPLSGCPPLIVKKAPPLGFFPFPWPLGGRFKPAGPAIPL